MNNFSRELFISKAIEEKHSDAFIDITKNYIDNLNSKNLPVIFSLQHFAIEIGMQSDFIDHLISDRNQQYNYFLLQKKNKKSAPREIMAPREELKFIQRWINFNILQKLSYNKHIHGFVPGSSILQHAQVHHKSKFLLKIDLLKFFDTIDEKKVYKMFRSMGYIKNLAWDFAKICTAQHRFTYWQSFSAEDLKILQNYDYDYPNILPQGAPTSPLLANLVASRLDKRLGSLSKKLNSKYTRYADDLCFSADKIEEIPSLKIISKIIEEEGFFINKEKIKFSKLGMKQYVTGLSISDPLSVSVSKSKRREVFKHLYFAEKFGIESHLLKLKSKGKKYSNYQNWLLGHIMYNYSINKKIGKQMFEIYNRINWSIETDAVTISK